MSLLSISLLKKSFLSPQGGRACVVDIPAFSLEAGQQLALKGESGSGKTTFLHLVAGILTADSGTITLDGRELTGLSEPVRDRVRAQSIGYIFQTFNLLQGFTCLENVLLGSAFASGENPERSRRVLESVGLGSHLHHFPSQLSTGQQQRVAVARAMVNRPKLVLADEPTANLDGRNTAEALALIQRSCRDMGAALLLVSHDPRVLDSFSQVRDFWEINHAAQEVLP